MKTKIKALTSFMHGRTHAHVGNEVEVSKGEADELVKAGMAEVVAGEAAPADEGVDDLLGGDSKMEDQPENKMESEPENKAGGKSKISPKAK